MCETEWRRPSWAPRLTDLADALTFEEPWTSGLALALAFGSIRRPIGSAFRCRHRHLLSRGSGQASGFPTTAGLVRLVHFHCFEEERVILQDGHQPRPRGDVSASAASTAPVYRADPPAPTAETRPTASSWESPPNFTSDILGRYISCNAVRLPSLPGSFRAQSPASFGFVRPMTPQTPDPP